MNIFVHYPETEEGKRELGKRAASLHNQAILRYLKQLSCPEDQKQSLVKAILAEHK